MGKEILKNLYCMDDEELVIKKLGLFEELIDRYIDTFDVYHCIDYLIDSGFTKEDMLKMKFDEKDIDERFEELKESEE